MHTNPRSDPRSDPCTDPSTDPSTDPRPLPCSNGSNSHADLSKASTALDAAVPLVYSCSGCSSAAQLANHVALRLDRCGAAEMSCIAGVGGDVPHLLKTAHSGRPIIALDGCPLVCVNSTLRRHGITPARHYQLQQYGVKKRAHEDFDIAQAAMVLERVLDDLHYEPLAKPLSLPVHPQRAEPAHG